MRRLLAYFTLLVASVGWFIGCSPDAVHWLYQRQLIQDDYRYGDLYRFSNLADFRVPVQHCPAPTPPPQRQPIQLVLLGDSFTEKQRISGNHFVADSFVRHFVAEPSYVPLATSKRKILIIQTVERHFRERFDTTYTQLSAQPLPPPAPKTWWDKALGWKVPYSEEGHASVLFASDFMFTIKEWKAALNQRVFGRIDKKVVLTPDEANLLYYLPVQSGINSIFDPISDSQIATLVKHVNATYSHYKQLGFDEVYLSIIPNKASIVGQQMGKYNHLIERVQQHPDLQMPFIDMYAPLLAGGSSLFDKGDTHWNCKGKQMWIDAVNQRLMQQP